MADLLSSVLKLASNVGYLNPITAIPTAVANKITTGEFVPGVNVGNVSKRLTSNNNINYDILDDFSRVGRTGQINLSPVQSSTTQQINDPNTGDVADSYGLDYSNVSGSGSGGTSTGYTSADIATLEQNANLLNSLLGRIDTSINQGKQKIGDQYGKELADANLDKIKQLETYGSQRQSQKTNREQALGTISRNANTGMSSLQSLLGRASGSGSSVYQQLLPYLVGNDMSKNRRQVMNTTGTNLQNIDKAQNQYEADFASVLQDLANQRKSNEENLMSGIEGQRQNLLAQQIANAAQLAQAQGGGYNAVKSAVSPYQAQYETSLNAVDSFFNQFKPNYTPNQKAAPTPELGTYTIDRAAVNGASSPQAGVDETNPYAALLRRKLQGEA
jgi:hypothetical protein